MERRGVVAACLAFLAPTWTDPVIRTYEGADRAGCLAVFESNVPRYFRPSERQEFEDFLDELPGPYFVLEAEGEIVGCGGYALAEEGRRADLCWGMIHRGHHGRGLGKQLTRRRIDEALARPTVEEVVAQTSQLTRGFYQSLGFQTIEVERDGFAPGLDRCEMRLTTASRRPGR